VSSPGRAGPPKAPVQEAPEVLADCTRERFTSFPETEQEAYVNNLSKAVELTRQEVPAFEEFSPAGDGGYVVFAADLAAGWSFATRLRRHARRMNLRLRIGAATGPVLKTAHRNAVGGSILVADGVSAFSSLTGC
jgi:hypothetical protein